MPKHHNIARISYFTLFLQCYNETILKGKIILIVLYLTVLYFQFCILYLKNVSKKSRSKMASKSCDTD